MKLIRVARMAFEAYLIISAVRRSVMIVGAWQRLVEVGHPLGGVRGRSPPSTTRSGCMKSLSAAPSRRNSGFETT